MTYFRTQYLEQQNPRCIILTSGTLAPLKSLETGMEISIPIKLSNAHIINDSQVFVKVVSQGPDGTVLDSNFHNR